MLYFTVGCLVLALVAGLLGFGGLAAGAAGVAKLLFVIFVILGFASLLGSLMRRHS